MTTATTGAADTLRVCALNYEREDEAAAGGIAGISFDGTGPTTSTDAAMSRRLGAP